MPSETPGPVHCQLYALFVLVATALRPRPGYWVSHARCISTPPRLPVLLGGGAGPAGTGPGCVRVPRGGRRVVVGDSAGDPVGECDLVPGRVAVDAGAALP